MYSKILTPLCFIFPAAVLSGQSLTLRSDNQFLGKVEQITEKGGIAVTSPYSPEPINFRLDAIREVVLDESEQAPASQRERLTLSNGDVLPGSLIAMSETEITYKGLFAEELAIPRSQLSLLRVNVQPQASIYRGPAPLDEWTGSGVTNWIFNDEGKSSEALLLNEQGTISRTLELPSQFTLKFELAWSELPNMRINFCEDLSDEASEDEENSDRYYLAINRGGIQIRREQLNGGRRNQTLLSLKNPEALDDRQVRVELRCNRVLGTMELYLDDELVRQLKDQSESPPGSGISLIQYAGDNTISTLISLEVLTWDAISVAEVTGPDQKIESDGIISADGMRMSGQLISLQPSEDTPAEDSEPSLANSAFILKSPIVEEDVKLAYEGTRVLYFESKEPEEEKAQPAVFEIELHNEGRLSALELVMDDDFLTITHPLLGPLMLERRSVKSFQLLPLLDNS